MTLEEYFDVIGLMQVDCSMMHLSETRTRLDLADWVEQVYHLCRMAENANKIIADGNQSMHLSIDEMFVLRSLSENLNDILFELSLILPDMKDGKLPGQESDWDEDEIMWCDFIEDDFEFTTDGLRGLEFIGDKDKKIIDEADATVRNILTEYRNTLAKLSTIVERAQEVLENFHDTICDIDSEISSYLTNWYYSFLEWKETAVEERLIAQLYEKYIDSLNEQLETRHWAAMLKDYLTENDDDDSMKKIIKECFSYTHAIDISDTRINTYLRRECRDTQDINEFFNYFLEVAILQSKVRSDIKIIRRPLTEEDVEPLPSGVVQKIRDNAALNRLFRDALGRVAENVGAGKNWKWSHVKKVLEDDGFIIPCGQSDFGRLINGILPDIKDEHVRQSVKNNPVHLGLNDRNCNYRNISETNTSRSVLIAIGDEFKELRSAME